MSANFNVTQLITKMKMADHDFRFMALNDLTTEVSKTTFVIDEATQDSLVNQILALMSDTNTEVKNQAVKAIGVLIKKLPEKKLLLILDKMVTYSVAPKDEQLRDIANLGLRTVIREVGQASDSAGPAVGQLLPKLLAQIGDASSSQDVLLNAVELLNDTLTRFETTIAGRDDLQRSAKKTLIPLLGNTRPAVRKRSVDALAQLVALAPNDNSDVCASVVVTVVHPALSGKGKVDKVTAVSLVGALALFGLALSCNSELTDDKHIIDVGGVASTDANGDTEMGDDGSDDDQTMQQAEIRETALQTLERLVLKCPKETAGSAQPILDLCSSLMTWDPNYAAGDDGDDVDMNADDEEDEEFADDYSDDDDVSWKVRRAAARTICAVIETRPELLASICKSTVPLIVNRFSEREESVRLEVLATFRRLLQVIGLLSGTISTSSYRHQAQVALDVSSDRAGREGTPNVLKRKRGDDGTPLATPAISEGSPVSLLRQQASTITKALLKQLNLKSVASSQAIFELLDALVLVLQGGLEDRLAPLFSKIETALSTDATNGSIESTKGSATSLKLAVLALVSDIFACQPMAALEGSLQTKIVPCITKCSADKYNKTASAALGAMSALVHALRPTNAIDQTGVTQESKQMVSTLLAAVAERLNASGTDAEVRNSAVETLGDLIGVSGSALDRNLTKALKLLQEALHKEVTRTAAVRVLSKIASAPVVAHDPAFVKWAAEVLPEVATFLRQSNRALRVESFSCLPPLTLISGASLQKATVVSLLDSIAPSISTEDLSLLPSALNTVINLLHVQSKVVLGSASFTKHILSAIYGVANSPSIQSGPSFDALLAFFATYAQSGGDAREIIERLRSTTSRAGPRCIGAVVTQTPEYADEFADAFCLSAVNAKSSPGTIVFSLTALGEIGRIPSFIGSKKAFSVALKHLSGSNEESIRTAAAFALGNIAVGQSDLVSQIITEVSEQKTDDKKRSLFLHALKEFISHSDADTLATKAEALWSPLFSICAVNGVGAPEPSSPSATPDEKKARDKRVDAKWKADEPIREQWKQTEISRNVAADCLGKITLTDPSKYIMQLQARLQDSLAGVRAAIISAVRYTLADSNPASEKVLEADLVSFLSLMRDPNLDVRRSALTAFNAAAHHKAHLIRQDLPGLLTMLYEETKPKPDLVRIVEMGPFKHRVDDGLEVRKAAYETCFTLLDTCLARLDVHDLLGAVLRGISDDNEIRAICYLMIVRLSQVAPVAVTQKLDSIADAFTSLFNETLKETAVKQEYEKLRQMQLAALRAFVVLSKLASPAVTPKFSNAVAAVRVSIWKEQFSDLEADPSKTSSSDMDTS